MIFGNVAGGPLCSDSLFLVVWAHSQHKNENLLRASQNPLWAGLRFDVLLRAFFRFVFVWLSGPRAPWWLALWLRFWRPGIWEIYC